MRVAINGSLLGGQESGVERSIRGLVRGLDEIIGTDELHLYVGSQFRVGDWSPRRVRLHRSWVPCRFRALRIAHDQVLFPMAAGWRRVDLVHGPGYVIPLFGRPAVVTVHDVIALKYPDLCKRANVAYFRLVLPRSIRRARRIIVPSHAVQRDIVSLFHVPEDRVRVIPPGIDECFGPPSEQERARARAVYGLPDRFILFVGNIEPKKNLEALIKVFFAMRLDRKLDHKLVVVGKKGWKYDGVFELIRQLQFAEHVRFLGYVPIGDLPGIYGLADCFAFPSLVEGFGIPPLEAMACGTPVITSDDPALVEATGDAALHVAAADKKAFREALESLMEDRALRRRLREAGLRHVAAFTWKRSAERTLDVYREAIASSGDR